ncbi:MAG: 3-methyladenine DNA glycosylase [Candidatus Abawacabacteria bacterium RIFCSPHIGHO2_01_FULL_46_8]|uniref:Putative 3-methyladenine DNA glycosylase n=1 Tax=Candidatus Abawacabacteria bacterium RIFCSPHIGHO2_01_FULL_46_8 TaxID=1817815 RepID=A0A1F4XLJ7_9BACT|nr:MAG: 3-methyladenine DNA glycosylase [Candidatus Abawacabacteria bacterium RIFCSPHIGHO2_01_FULL_46_8]
MSQRLPRSFFARPTLQVAEELLGKLLVYQAKVGRINEVEAYIGADDPACHTARGLTPRNQVMFGPAGFSYVYFIYGKYHCLNVVTEQKGFPAAVLIRGVEPLQGIDRSSDGPGKLCLAYGLDKSHNGIDLCRDADFYLADDGQISTTIKKTPRIGIKLGLDKNWRFVAG